MKADSRKTNRRKLFRILPAVLCILWMILIFSFSAQPDTESAQVSGSVSYRIVSGVNDVFRLKQSEEELVQAADKIEFPVRKIAHMSEFGILSVLYLYLFYAYGRKSRAMKHAFFLTAAYAAADEFHQIFVPGRAGRLTDVLIDSAGAFIALLIAGLIIKKFHKEANHI